MLSKIHMFIVLASVACAAVLPHANASLHPRDQSAAAILLQIAPSSASCASTLTGCATNVEAAPYLIKSFQDYGITNVHEIAAILALISYESGDFKYNVNISPGRPGQGTRNMMEWGSMYEYISSIPALKSQLAAISTAPSGEWTSDQMNTARALVLGDEYTWASGAWWLTTQCPSARPLLQAGKMAGWDAYMACDGVSPTDPDRLAKLTLAETAFGITFS